MAQATSPPPGGWPSPISAMDVAQAGMSSRGLLSAVCADRAAVYWREYLPDQGRYQIYRLPHGQASPRGLLPAPFSAASQVHEYGGGEYTIDGDLLLFSHAQDQRLYRVQAAESPTPLTPEATAVERRYADGRLHPDRRTYVTVQEVHRPGEAPVNRLAWMRLDQESGPVPLAEGHAFYAAPRFSPDGRQLCWLTWDPPQMPWNGTTLWLADYEPAGRLRNTRQIAGGPAESIFQPAWSPTGVLHFVSDRSGWWNLYRYHESAVTPVTQMQAELGSPAWALGLSRYAFLGKDKLALIVTESGQDRLQLLDGATGKQTPLPLPFSAFYPAYLASDGAETLFFLASSASTTQALYRLQPGGGQPDMLRRPSQLDLDGRMVTVPETIEVDGDDGEPVHGFVYWPRNPGHSLGDQLPPLIIDVHGGPTQQSMPQMNIETLFWTSRGFAVAAVNYAGSSGYGRNYRERLNGQWGVADVEDCVRVAKALVDSGRVHPDQLVIRGSSAGGLTSLLAAARGLFAAATSSYGLIDLEAVQAVDHKFEAHYLISLVGDDRRLWRARSPLNADWNGRCPVLLLHGDRDSVIPVEQARSMAESLRERGHPYAYLELAGEGHGFRHPQSVERALLAELAFYRQVLSLESPEPLPRLDLD